MDSKEFTACSKLTKIRSKEKTKILENKRKEEIFKEKI